MHGVQRFAQDHGGEADREDRTERADQPQQVDRGIAGARLGNSRAEVRAALGTPASARSGTNDFGRFLQWRFKGGITVIFQGRREVSTVSTTGRGDRTRRGAGVGSTEAAVKARVNEGGGPPPGASATGMQMLMDAEQGTVVVLQHFATAEDMEAAARVFEAMGAGEPPGTRASVDMCEVQVEMQA